MFRLRPAVWPAGLCLAVAIPACSGPADDLPRVPVSGKVTVAGQPLAKGSIRFRPEGGGPEAAAPVEEGAFQIPRTDGPTPGKYTVSVTESEERKLEPASAKFTIQPETKPSKAVIVPQAAEVKAEASNTFAFEFQRVETSRRSKGQAR